MPALDENDESLFDYDYGSVHDRVFPRYAGEHGRGVMGVPVYERTDRARGLLYPESELRRFYELPEDEPDAIIAVCDSKDTGADYAVLPWRMCTGRIITSRIACAITAGRVGLMRNWWIFWCGISTGVPVRVEQRRGQGG